MLLAFLRKFFARRPAFLRRAEQRSGCRPRLELLESRLVPSTLNVGGGNHPYASLAAALTAARNGDTIRVYGTAHVSSGLSIGQNDLTLAGADSRSTIEAAGSFSDPILSVAGSDATISGLTIQDDRTGGGAGILVSDAGSAEIRNDVFTGEAVGVEVRDGTANAQILDNSFNGPRMSFGIQLTDGAGGDTIQGNSIVRASQDGIYLNGSGNDVIEGNAIVGSGVSGIHLVNSSLAQLSGNQTDFNSADGIFIEGGGFNTVEDSLSGANRLDGVRLSDTVNNLIQDDLFLFNGRYGVGLNGANLTTIQGDRILQNGQGGVFIDANSVGTVLQNDSLQTDTDAVAARGTADRSPAWCYIDAVYLARLAGPALPLQDALRQVQLVQSL